MGLTTLFSHTSEKKKKTLGWEVCEPLCVLLTEANLRGAALCDDSWAWYVEVSHFSSFLYLSVPPPPPRLLRISWVFPISSFLKRCCDSQGIQFTVVKAYLKSLSVSNEDGIKMYNNPGVVCDIKRGDDSLQMCGSEVIWSWRHICPSCLNTVPAVCCQTMWTGGKTPAQPIVSCWETCTA